MQAIESQSAVLQLMGDRRLCSSVAEDNPGNSSGKYRARFNYRSLTTDLGALGERISDGFLQQFQG